jgi:hypothetical protein
VSTRLHKTNKQTNQNNTISKQSHNLVTWLDYF